MQINNQRQHEEDEVLLALTEGIGGILGRVVRRQYYELKNQLLLNSRYRKFDDELKQFAIDMLSLNVFHRLLILPMSGAEGLWTQMQRFSITSIKMRTHSYKSKDFDRMKIIANRFFSILNKQKIEVELLAYESIDGFMVSLEGYVCRGTNEKE